jgi:hypothetical protein
MKELVRFLQSESAEECADLTFGIPVATDDLSAPQSALESVLALAEAIRKAAADSLQSQEQHEKDQSIKLDEAKALHIEVNASPLGVYWCE